MREWGTVVVFGALALAAGCKNKEECDKARMATARAWRDVRELAVNQKMTAADEDAHRSDAQKEDWVKAWTGFENRADLLSSSFQTEQITWDPAAQGKKKLRDEFEAFSTSNPGHGTESFRTLLKGAEDFTALAEKSCK